MVQQSFHVLKPRGRCLSSEQTPNYSSSLGVLDQVILCLCNVVLMSFP